MTGWPLDFGDIDELVDLIKDGTTIKSIEREPDKIRASVSSVWVQCVGFEQTQLSGNLTLKVNVWAIVPRKGLVKDQAALADVVNQLLPVLNDVGGPTGPSYPSLFPAANADQSALPAFVIPVDLITTTPKE